MLIANVELPYPIPKMDLKMNSLTFIVNEELKG